MFMAETTGTINWLKVNKQATDGGDFGLFSLQPADGTSEELFFIWFSLSDRTPPTATDWIARNMHVAMLRDALVQKLQVIVFHDDASNFYTSLELLPA
jgi:hypothetical protein